MTEATKELKTLFRQSSHYLTGRVGVILLGFVSFPLFTRLFSVSDYGMMSLVIKVVATVAVLAKLGIQNSVLRFYQEHTSKEEPSAVRRYFSTFLFGTAGVAAIITIVFVIITWVLPGSLVTLPVKKLLLLASLFIFTRAMNSILSGFLRVQERTRVFNVLDVASKALTIVLVCAFFFGWQRNVWAFFAGTILVDLLLALGITLFLVSRGLLDRRLFDPALFRTALLFGVPLIFYELGFMILDSGDRILVEHYLGSLQLGYYSAAYNMSYYVLDALMVPLNLALFPIYMRLWVREGKAQTQEFLSKAFDAFLMIAVGMVVTVIVLRHDLIVVLASSKFRSAQSLLPTLLVGVLFYAMINLVNPGLLIYKKTRTMAKLIVYAGVLNIAMNIVLLPRMGLQAAALATLVSYVFFFLITMRASFKLLPYPLEIAALVRYLLAAGVTAAVLSRVETANAFLNVGVKGLLGIALYLGILCLIDPRIRKVATKWDWSVWQRSRQAAVIATAPVHPAGKE